MTEKVHDWISRFATVLLRVTELILRAGGVCRCGEKCQRLYPHPRQALGDWRERGKRRARCTKGRKVEIGVRGNTSPYYAHTSEIKLPPYMSTNLYHAKMNNSHNFIVFLRTKAMRIASSWAQCRQRCRVGSAVRSPRMLLPSRPPSWVATWI